MLFIFSSFVSAEGLWLWSPAFLAPETEFLEDSFSMDLGLGVGSGFEMIQVHYIYCALYFYYYYIVIYNGMIIQITT